MVERINGIVYKIHASHSVYSNCEFYVQEYHPMGGAQLKIGEILHSGSAAECFKFLATLREGGRK